MIPDFEQAEGKLIKDTHQQSYAETRLADVELRLCPDDREMTESLSVYGERNDCHFIGSKYG
ncbi:MAG: hypothetical protein PVJ63_05770 [Thioalkalispiraceae bacterium]|jgi:hypothetical protein